MKKRILSMLLALVTLLSMLPIPVSAASTLEEAMAEVNVYGKKEDLNWLTMNGSVKTQHYTYYNYQSPITGETKEIPAYCVDPNLYGVPALAPDAGTPIKYSASETGNDPKVMGIIANGYPHIDLGTLGVNTIEEAYYATKTALWCYLLPNWNINKLGINPALSGEDRAAAERVLAAAEFAYTRGMRWNALVEPSASTTPPTATTGTLGASRSCTPPRPLRGRPAPAVSPCAPRSSSTESTLPRRWSAILTATSKSICSIPVRLVPN